MVNISSLFSGKSFASGFANTSLMANKPNFELQFNMLQNTIIDRLNEKIEAVTADDKLVNTIDPFLVSEQKKLLRFERDIRGFIFQNGRNINATGELVRQLNKMDSALSSNDTDAFNTALESVNSTVSKMTVTNGTTVGIVIDDGINAIRRDGLVKFDDSGTPKKATSFSDFADTSEAQTAVANALTKAATIGDVTLLKAEGAEVLRQRTSKNLKSTILQIEAVQVADLAEKTAEITKLREEYSQLLNAVSLAFDSSQVLSEQLSSALFDPNAVPSGSVVNLFI